MSMENILTKIGVFLLGGIIGYLFYLNVGKEVLNILFELVVCIFLGLVLPIVYTIRKVLKNKV